MKNIAVISLGCDKNRVDTEHMLFRISRGDYGISDISDAEVIIINTCAFIESARQESIDTILSCAELKKTGKLKKLIVTGCLPQKYSDELKAELPEVDAFLGAFEYDKILAVLQGDSECAAANADSFEQDFYAAENCGRLLTTFPHVAYVKIAEGCDNHCTFCTIPSIRGKYRSRDVADIKSEVQRLADDGVKEVILVAQDVTRFGEDKGENRLIELLNALESTDIERIRLLYCYPERVTDALIDKISASPKIANYIDIPIQHFSDKILKTMNRRMSGKAAVELINKLHAHGITVRTTLMVGFPGEGEAEFAELVEAVKKCAPEYIGVFAYSKEDGTPAAKLKDQVKQADKLKRVKALGAVGAAVSRAFNERFVGKTIDVVYEDIDFDKNLFMGRAEFQAPDVDGRVYFTADEVDVGKTYQVTVTHCDDYDLYGEVQK